MYRFCTALVLSLATWATQAAPPAAASPWTGGTFELAKEANRSGRIVVDSITATKARINLEAAACLSACGTPAQVKRGAAIVDGFIYLDGERARYRESAPDSDTAGTGHSFCVLNIVRPSASTLQVKQEGDCWWFGRDVNVSGTYKLVGQP
jgi:hypothetical protein